MNALVESRVGHYEIPGHFYGRTRSITVALGPEQFHSLRQAINNRRQPEKTIREMEKVSRRILFESLPDTRRRKPLPKNVLGLI